jgi:hypothetical protein
MRATYQNTKEGDKIVFKEAGPHWFLDRINNAKKLETEKTYTVKEILVASSSTGVTLEETEDLMYELGWFEIPENTNDVNKE